MVAYEIAEIGADDWQDFRELRLQALADAPSAFGSRYDDWVAATEERWRARLRAVPYNLIARSGSGLLGMVSAVVDGDEVELISMYVVPAARGTGLAQALVERVASWAAEQGRTAFLMVRTDNAAAIASYRRAGFVDRGVPAGWPAGTPPENRMERRPR